MLKAIDLKKQYKPKNGQIVNALDGVTINFSDTGMVFILGKSGSGKSTLLNVLGGLDKYDSGEVIVKGKSSKDFSQADFDSYRNTFIGFIFQEYNILQEFSVEKNIGLALELQGKKADKEAINALIEQVDLKGYGKRKPNTLSGGQKQRVAIARALVKNPEIIMADEPTGALDSKTGAQVLDTLKKLSKEKLVIVVSHDREFAEYYADRIIEISDGKIISDQYKHGIEPTITNGLEIVDDKVLTIKKGTKLDKEKLDEINNFLEKQDNDIIISVDGNANKEFKKFAKINDEGQKETFKDTTNEDIKLKDYDGNVKLIRSKMPMKDSIKMGASGLKAKRFRLVLTILLSAIAFGLFGLADTMASYNKINNTVTSMQDSNIDYASFKKYKKTYYSDGSKRYNVYNTNINDEDLNMLKEKFNIDFLGVYSFQDYGYCSIENVYDAIDSNYYTKEICGLTEGSLTQFNKFGTLIGNYPENYDEVIITEYIAQTFVQGNYRDLDTNEKVEINTVNDMLNKNIRIMSKDYKVVGILDTGFDYNRYKKLKDETEKIDLSTMMLSNELRNLRASSAHSLLFCKEGFLNSIRDTKFKRIYDSEYLYGASIDDVNDNIIYFDSSKTNLNIDEAIISSNSLQYYYLDLKNTFYNAYNESEYYLSPNDLYMDSILERFINYCSVNNKYNHLLNYMNYLDYIIEYYDLCNNDELLTEKTGTKWGGNSSNFEYYIPSESREIVKNEFEVFLEEYRSKSSGYCNYFIIRDMLKNGELKDEANAAYLSHGFDSSFTFDFYIDIIFNAMFSYGHIYYNDSHNTTENDLDIKLVNKIAYIFLSKFSKYIYTNEFAAFRMDSISRPYKFKVVGVRYVYDTSTSIEKNLILNGESEGYKALERESGNYIFTLGKLENRSTNALKGLVKFNYSDSDIMYKLNNAVMTSVENVNGFVEGTAKVFLYIGIGFAVFASLLLLNYITISISYKKREIGILRAIGARGMDVFKIFFSEAFIIAIINFILAFIGCLVACYFINRMFRVDYGFLLTVLHVGIRQLLLMFLVSLVVAIISSFIPVYLTARKKPIDAIRSAE